MKNSYEGVTDESAILAFIDSLERGQLLRHRLLRERNEGKLTLNSMITIASNYAAAADDARESLKASAIQNTRKRNSSNKRKNLPEEPQAPDMVATTFTDKGQTASAAEDAVVAVASRGAPQLPLWRHLPPCLTTNTTTCHVLPIVTLQESATTPTGTASLSTTSRQIKKLASSAAGDNGLMAKEKRTKTRSPGMAEMDEDPAPKPTEKAEGGAGKGNPIKDKKGAFHTFLGPPTAKAQRAAMRSLNATVPKICQYIRWSKVPVHWSCNDHPEHIPDGYYAMVVCLVIHGYEFSKCLMDGGSSLNIMYVETLTKHGLTKTQLRHSAVTFYGVVPGRQAKSLGFITLKVAFGSEENYRKEPITFEVVPFKSTYHVIFGRPAFHSFHARPCYIYNQLKMPGPDGIITIYGSFRKAKECEEGEAAFAEVVFFGEEFKEIHAATDPAEMQPSKQEVSASLPTFKPTVDTKQVELVAGNATKTTAIGTNLSPK
jgi:hypothetical protein